MYQHSKAQIGIFVKKMVTLIGTWLQPDDELPAFSFHLSLRASLRGKC
jgi:hypothetical protein